MLNCINLLIADLNPSSPSRGDKYFIFVPQFSWIRVGTLADCMMYHLKTVTVENKTELNFAALCDTVCGSRRWPFPQIHTREHRRAPCGSTVWGCAMGVPPRPHPAGQRRAGAAAGERERGGSEGRERRPLRRRWPPRCGKGAAKLRRCARCRKDGGALLSPCLACARAAAAGCSVCCRPFAGGVRGAGCGREPSAAFWELCGGEPHHAGTAVMEELSLKSPNLR